MTYKVRNTLTGDEFDCVAPDDAVTVAALMCLPGWSFEDIRDNKLLKIASSAKKSPISRCLTKYPHHKVY